MVYGLVLVLTVWRLSFQHAALISGLQVINCKWWYAAGSWWWKEDGSLWQWRYPHWSMHQDYDARIHDTCQWWWTDGYWVLDYSTGGRTLFMSTLTGIELSEKSQTLMDELLDIEVESVAKHVH